MKILNIEGISFQNSCIGNGLTESSGELIGNCLVENKGLETLCLGGNLINGGALRIMGSLGVNRTLKKLWLNYNNIPSDVVTNALCKSLRLNNSLRELDLFGNKFAPNHIDQIRAAWADRTPKLTLEYLEYN